MDMNNINNIPAEKFRFAVREEAIHDSKLDTKPATFFQDAFRRFSKNKGAVVGGIVITFLVLFAIIAPMLTPFVPSYYDMRFANATPRLEAFANSNIDFWDGYKATEANYITFIRHKALSQETGKEVIKNGEYTVTGEGSGALYSYRYDTYTSVGFGKYKDITVAEYLDIQRYQNETGRQVLYPIVKYEDRPTKEHNKYDANIYYVVEDTVDKYGNVVVDADGNPVPNLSADVIRPKLDENGDLIPNYWDDSTNALAARYNSIRIAGDNGQYIYGRRGAGTIEVRTDYYEYYIYQHTQVLNDGIESPSHIFGATGTGKDIFACLSYGARFSFIFAIVVAVFNFIVGVIYGSIAGYYGGKIDLAMERFSEILGSVPTMIVITLLKYHMGRSSQVLVLLISFFITGWIGMAGTTRMQFYRFKNQEYVLAARTLGAKDSRIMFKHIFPNGLGTIVTSVALIIPAMIYSETSLSYLGIINLEAGNTTSVGTLIAAGQGAIMQAPHILLFPCAFLVMLMLSFNLFGNGLRDAFNPSLRGTEG